jgi:hypothetical protein
VALLSGEDKAQEIQLAIQYAPDPPFHSGSPDSAPPELVKAVRAAYEPLAEARLLTARRIRAELNLEDPEHNRAVKGPLFLEGLIDSFPLFRSRLLNGKSDSNIRLVERNLRRQSSM